jgi:flagellar motility protein MotE (MotC chaperone)
MTKPPAKAPAKPARRVRGRAGRGILVLLALLLASSGALRMGQLAGAALANSEAAPEAAPEACPPPPVALAEALAAREAQVTVLEAAMAERKAALALAEEAISRRMAELEAAETSLKATLALADGAAEDDLLRLTTVYETMKPKDAAALFETMAPEFAAGFLGRMRPEAAAAVLSGMSPDAAYSISVLIAGRNAAVPKE